MTEEQERQRVVALALEWEGTPYVSEGRIKHLAADCTFFAKVFEEAGVIPPVVIPHYSPQAHVNRQACAYMTIVQQYAKREVVESEAQPGDIVLYNIARTFSHGGVVVKWPVIIHADMNARRVVRAEGHLGRLDGHERKFFSFW